MEFRDAAPNGGGGHNGSPSAVRASQSSTAPPTKTTGPAIVLDERKMYTVDWSDGATFGFTVTPVNSDRGTVLLLAKRTAPAASLEAAGLHEVLPGDMLVAIGDERVYHLGADNATRYLRAVRKPVRLTLQLSPFGGSGKSIPDLAPNEYDYLWETGPLGLVLTPDPKSKLPVIKRINHDKIESPALLQDVAVGDELIIRDLPKPILLRFRKPLQEHLNAEVPALQPDEYDFLWEYGPLGLVVGEARGSGLPFVRSFTGKGTSRQLGLVQAEDEIVLVNDRSAELMGFAETMDYIMNVPKPAVLRFRRRHGLVENPVAATLAMAAMHIAGEPPQQVQAQSQAPPQLQPTQHLQQLQPPRKASKAELRDLSYPMSPPRRSSQSQSPPQASFLGDRGSFTRGGNRSSLSSPSDEPLPPPVPTQAQAQPQAPLALPMGGPRGSSGSEDYFTIDQSAFYQIQWTDGPFGLTVREAMSKLGAVMLITKRTGKATCAGLKRVAVGDILVRIGDKNVGELGFDAATRFLRTVMKPVVLTFQAID
ncbi:hypothetical protein PybrP1_009731 [[Pythium] brassicae (nom. inval.)]|nr:hypothetical protein PybrP1_009731 [[Pythium] brassicae (nom. inval.)]